ncbi:MAG: trypsin-like peptidase domain-containing protein [Spirochaetales bacterium]|nr:trypsin-like peptidase domain-containing protein [Spirochaetales bacterium]
MENPNYDPAKQIWSSKVHSAHDPRESCFPLIHHHIDEKRRVLTVGILGSAFFISPSGLFLTARHVVEEYSGNIKSPLKAILLRQPNFKMIPVIGLHHYPNTDISIGIVDLTNDGWSPKPFRISKRRLPPNTPISAFGYPKGTIEKQINNSTPRLNFNPNFYEGTCLDFHINGHRIAKWPVYEHSFQCEPGISGGPVFRQVDTVVHGLCCTGFSPPPGGTFADLSFILDKEIPFVEDSWNTISGISINRPDMIPSIEE